MMLKLFLVVLIAGSLAFLFKEPQFVEARNFALTSVGLKSSTVYTDLFYFNPNGFGIQMKKADLDIYVDDKFIGHTLIDTLINIPRRDTFSIPVSMDVEMKKIFPNALSILLKEEVMLRIEGTAKLGKAGLFVNVPVRYEGKQRLR
jgi:LEA14-like dessication related protein